VDGKTIETCIAENFAGDLRNDAADFVAFCRANGMEFVRGGGYWKDKMYWYVNYNGESVCYIAINEHTDNTCVVWSDDSGRQWFSDCDTDERTKNIAWRNVNVCDNPDACGACPAKKGTPMTVFGKEYGSVCLTSFSFVNPNAETVECMKTLFGIRMKDIRGGVS
jgi:hypothetical protein